MHEHCVHCKILLLLQVAVNNTFVIARERDSTLTVPKVKAALAKALARCVSGDQDKRDTAAESDKAVSVRVKKQVEDFDALRFDSSVPHALIPHPNRRRRRCIVHLNRKETVFICEICKVHLCMGECWKRFHYRTQYLLDTNKYSTE